MSLHPTKPGRRRQSKAVRRLTISSKVAGLGVSSKRQPWKRQSGTTGSTAASGWRITQERRLTPASLYALCSDAVAAPTSNKIIGKWAGYVPSDTGVQALMTIRFRENGGEAETQVSPRQNISRESNYVADDNGC